MQQLSPAMLLEAGYTSLTRQQVDDLLKDFYEALQTAVGEYLAGSLSPQEMELFGTLFPTTQDDSGSKVQQVTGEWLESRIPDMSDRVSAVIDAILADLRELATASDDRYADSSGT